MQISSSEHERFIQIFNAPSNNNIRSLTPGEFPRFILYLFERDGLYRPVYVDGPGDGGVDIELLERNPAYPRLLGVVQCKRYFTNRVNGDHIGYFANAANQAHAERRYYFTTTGYMPAASREARLADVLTYDPLSIRLWILDIRRREDNRPLADSLPNKDAIPVPIICVANNKGGVGKTSIVANMASAMAEEGKNVLVIDTDPQANLTKWLLPGEHESLDPMRTLYSVLTHQHPLYPVVVRRTSLPGVMLIPSHRDIYNLPPNVPYQQERVLLQSLAALPLGDLNTDIILIDTQPALYSLTRAAVVAAQYLLFPFRPDEPSGIALNNLCDFVGAVEASHMLPPLHILGGVATCVDNTKLAKEMRDKIRQDALAQKRIQQSGLNQLSFWIGDTRQRSDYPKAEHEKTSVIKLRARDASDDIMKLTKEVLARVNSHPVLNS